MSQTRRRLDPFFDKARIWPDELRAVRAIVLEFPLAEELKWRQPCYTYDGANVAILHEMRAYCGLGFFKGALIDDPGGLLAAPGENSQASRQMRFHSVAEVAEKADALRGILARAIAVEQAGLKVEFTARHELDYPEELIARIEADPEFADAFEALTPGRKRGYVLHFSGAKQSATRARRIEKQVPRILERKGMHDR